MNGPMKLAAAAAVAAAIFAISPADAQEADDASPEAGAQDTTTMPPGRGPGMGRGMGQRMMQDGRPGRARQGGPGPRGAGPAGNPIMFEMLFAAIDADASETLSLDEVLAVQERVFARIDRDGDGELTAQELRRVWGPMRRNR